MKQLTSFQILQELYFFLENQRCKNKMMLTTSENRFHLQHRNYTFRDSELWKACHTRDPTIDPQTMHFPVPPFLVVRAFHS